MHIDKIHIKSIQSHRFIKFDEKLTDELFTKLSEINYNSRSNTCGPILNIKTRVNQRV